jgi:PIN domain nuclease of toxin-antitoxin system
LRLLIDTHLLLWAAGQPDRLSEEAHNLLQDPAHDLSYSVASLWEITIKRGLGRADLRVEPRVLRRGLRDHGYGELPITADHALAVDMLPAIHRDPFDRILVAQAMIEGITLLTGDPLVASYPAPIRRV